MRWQEEAGDQGPCSRWKRQLETPFAFQFQGGERPGAEGLAEEKSEPGRERELEKGDTKDRVKDDRDLGRQSQRHIETGCKQRPQGGNSQT